MDGRTDGWMDGWKERTNVSKMVAYMKMDFLTLYYKYMLTIKL